MADLEMDPVVKESMIQEAIIVQWNAGISFAPNSLNSAKTKK